MRTSKSLRFILSLILSSFFMGSCSSPKTTSPTATGISSPFFFESIQSTPTVDLGTSSQPTQEVEVEILSSSGNDHVVQFSLKSGETVTLDTIQRNSVELQTQYFELDSGLGLIDSIIPQTSGYLVTFNNGETLQVNSIDGFVEYAGDFGLTELSLETVNELYTLENRYKQEIDRSFYRDASYNIIQFTFKDGSKQFVYMEDGDLRVQTEYKGFPTTLYVNRASIKYDWQKKVVKISHPDFGILELSNLHAPDEFQTHVQGFDYVLTDLGHLKFNWQGLVSSEPVEGAPLAFTPPYSLSLSDGTQLPIDLIYYSCPPDAYDCLKLDGEKTYGLNLDQVQSIIPGKDSGSGIIKYMVGGEKFLEVNGFNIGWALGEIDLPFSTSAFKKIIRSDTIITSSEGPFNLLIGLADGEETAANVIRVGSATETTAPDPVYDVLHLIEFPLPMGLWLVEKNWLEIKNDEGVVSVFVFGQPYVLDAASDMYLDLMNPYGYLTLTMDKIAFIHINPSINQPAEPINIRLTTRDGETYAFPAEKIQFVRYPDRIFDGTMYQIKLGAWFWRRFDTLEVQSGSSTTDVDFNRIRRLSLSGEYPDWDIELEGSTSGEILRGKVVPEKVESQGPGIASWDADREGFWFSWQNGHAFLFVPAKNIAEIRIEQ